MEASTSLGSQFSGTSTPPSAISYCNFLGSLLISYCNFLGSLPLTAQLIDTQMLRISFTVSDGSLVTGLGHMALAITITSRKALMLSDVKGTSRSLSEIEPIVVTGSLASMTMVWSILVLQRWLWYYPLWRGEDFREIWRSPYSPCMTHCKKKMIGKFQTQTVSHWFADAE